MCVRKGHYVGYEGWKRGGEGEGGEGRGRGEGGIRKGLGWVGFFGVKMDGVLGWDGGFLGWDGCVVGWY